MNPCMEVKKHLCQFVTFFFVTVFTCTVSLKARAACSPLFSSLFRSVSRSTVFTLHPALGHLTHGGRKQKDAGFATDPLNIWPLPWNSLRHLVLLQCCLATAWAKKKADVSHIQWTASQLMKTSHYPKSQQKHSEMWDTSVGQWHP